ncbi:MAG: DUF4836 family protein [Bacteroidales bacterium]|nr:DUF4836 family protein [Bacteroidales bacterium]
MNIKQVFFTLIVLVFLASSCSSDKSEDIKHIPDNATFVFTVLPSQLISKSNVDDFSNTNFYKKMIEKDSFSISDQHYNRMMEFDYIFKNPKESGVDFNEQFFAFSISNKNGWQQSMAVNFGIADSDKFRALLTKAAENKMDSMEFVDENGVNFLISKKKDSKEIIAWNENTAIIYSVTKGYCNNEFLVEKAGDLVTQKYSNSISSNKTFVEFYENRKDISVWFNSDFVLHSLNYEYQTIAKMQMPINLKGIEYNYHISFEKGNAIAESQLVLPKELESLVDDYKIIKDDFDDDILKYIPAESFANFSIAIDAHELYRMIKDLYKERQVNIDGVESMAEAAMDIDIENMFSAINGELIINVHRVDIKEDSLMAKCGNSLDFKVSVLVKLDNDEVYKSFLKIFEDNEKKMVDGYYVLNDDKDELYATMVDNIMMITNEKVVIVNFVAKKELSPSLKDSDIAKHLNNYALFGKINLNFSDYANETQNYYNKQYSKIDKTKMRDKLEEVRLEPIDSYHSKVILEFKDKERNSLEVIFN